MMSAWRAHGVRMRHRRHVVSSVATRQVIVIALTTTRSPGIDTVLTCGATGVHAGADGEAGGRHQDGQENVNNESS